ncbi:MAG: peptidylprolyl isomerase [Oscillospiraceae bacterium]|nr:peptidylprolyl isomerase [Oscillospiraceae bacterium]
MKCKFCFAELEEGVTVCPLCGKELTEPEEIPAEESVAEETVEEIEETEEVEATESEEIPAETKKKGKGLKIALAVTGLVLLGAILAGAVLHFMDVIDTKRLLGIGVKNDIFNKTSYTVDNEKAEEKSEVVVATMGNQKLTNSELQAHYWMTVYDFLDYYGSYVSYMGLDTSKPLDEQIYDQETGKTYQQWFLENAIESWRRYATLVQMAEEAGHVLTPEQQAELDALPESIQKMAQENGYTDVEKFVDEQFYPGSSLAGYLNYNALTWKAICYYDVLYESLLPNSAEVEAYYAQHEQEFKEKKFSKEDGLYYDVRHILIPIDGEAGDVDGVPTYTDEQWAQCLAKAQKALDDFKADNGDEAAFAQLAKEISADPGSAQDGGLYTHLTKDTNFIADFKNWYMEEGRKPGDTGIVKNTESTTKGYHIMYFSGATPIWEYETESAVLTEKTNAMLLEAENKWPTTIEYKKVVLGQINMSAG